MHGKTLNIRDEEDYLSLGVLPRKDTLGVIWQLPDRIGRGFMRQIRLRPGLQLLIRDYVPNTTFAFAYEASSLPNIFSFILSGNIQNKFEAERESGDFLFSAGQTSLTRFQESRGRSISPAGNHVRMVNIWVSDEQLEYIFGKDSLGHPPLAEALGNRQLHFEKTNSAMQMALHGILHSPFLGPVQRAYLESKCIELICHQLSQFSEVKAAEREDNALLPDHVDLIHHARNLLLADLKEPPSITELAHKVGLNEHKLRQGFRRVFGTTIYDQLRRHRLSHARLLLQERREMNVAEVAYQVGYSDMKHFYQAFRKQYNMTPGSCRQ